LRYFVASFGGVGTAPPTVAVITGRSEFEAATKAPAEPLSNPVIEVLRVIEGVVEGFAMDQANPFAATPETDVTVPAPNALV
jgi:hypothetical protein